jgi:S-adenosylmethionine-diacylgycerolhomoserine-N-methlytransferase
VSQAALLMDRMYRRQRHIYDVTRKYYLLGRDDAIAALAPLPGESVLEIGCGTGRNLIAVARRFPNAAIFGLDVSSAMLETAGAALRRAGLDERVKLAQGDASDFDPQALFGRAAFDRVLISYALSMIPPWRAALAQAIDVVADGGALEIVDFGDQAALPGLLRAGLRRWLAAFDVTPRDALGEEAAALAQQRGARARAFALYRGYAVRATVDKPGPRVKLGAAGAAPAWTGRSVTP